MSQDSRLKLVDFFMILTIIFGARVAFSEEKEADSAEPHYFVGSKGALMVGFADGETHTFGGVGIFGEMTVVSHWLEIEAAIKVLTDGHGTILPIDLLFKIPFHFTKSIHPFIGVGPTMIPSFNGSSSLHFGGVAVAGAYFWFSHSWAFVAELNYNLVYEHGAVHELGGNVGIVYGW